MSYPHDIHTGVSIEEAKALEAWATKRRVLECGSWFGFSTIVMARSAARVTAVDWHHGDPQAGQMDTEDSFRQNLDRYGVTDKVEVVVGRFEAVLPTLPREAFDVAFLDGMHDAGSVRRDLDLAEPLIRRGGALLVHDYDVPEGWQFEVKATVDAWLAEHPGWQLVKTIEKLAILEDYGR